MPRERPTLATLIARVKADIVKNTESTAAFLRGTVEFVLAVVQAGLSHGNYGAVEYESQQTPPREKSSLEATIRWGSFLLDEPHIKAKGAVGTASFSGTNGTVIPSGRQLTNQDGVSYSTTADATVSGGTVSPPIQADRGGIDTNADAGTACTLTQPIAGIQSEGTYEASDGRDDETQPELLTRLRNFFRFPNRGGGTGDFARWAKEADSTVIFAWEFGKEPELGDVTVVIATADLGTPSSSLLTTVRNYILTLEPIFKGDLFVQAPVFQTLALTIANGPSDTPTRDAIEAAMLLYIQSVTVPGASIDLTELENAGQTIDSDLDITSPASDPNPGAFGVYNALSITWS